jgi:hypothetical protein
MGLPCGQPLRYFLDIELRRSGVSSKGRQRGNLLVFQTLPDSQVQKVVPSGSQPSSSCLGTCLYVVGQHPGPQTMLLVILGSFLG